MGQSVQDSGRVQSSIDCERGGSESPPLKPPLRQTAAAQPSLL